MLKIRRLLLFFVLFIFNFINIAALVSDVNNDYTNIFISIFYLFLSYLVYKEWKYSSVIAVIGYFVCVWLSYTFGMGWFGWFGLHIGLTILLIILFEIK